MELNEKTKCFLFLYCLPELLVSLPKNKTKQKIPNHIRKKYAEQITSHHLLACEQALINSAAGSMFVCPKEDLRGVGDAYQGSGTNC